MGNKIVKEVKYINSDGEYWVKREHELAWYNENGYLYRNRTKVLKEFTDNPYPKELTWAEKGKLCEIELYVGNDQLIVYKSGNVVKPHNLTTLAKVLETTDRQVQRLLKKCKDLRVISEITINGIRYYALNPIYKLRGNRISLTTYIAFQDVLVKELPEWVIKNYTRDIKELSTNIKVIK